MRSGSSSSTTRATSSTGPDFAGVHRDPEPVLPSAAEEPPVVGDPEGCRLGSGDVDPDHATIAPQDRLLHDDLVELVRECPVQAEDQAGSHRVLEGRPVHSPHGGRHDVVEILLAATVSLHRVEAQLHGRDVVLAIRAADNLVDRTLDSERRALDELGPVEELEVPVKRAVPACRNRDHVPELPVVLCRELDPLGVGDPPHDRRGDRAAEMTVELGQRDLPGEGSRHVRRIADSGHSLAERDGLSRRTTACPGRGRRPLRNRRREP